MTAQRTPLPALLVLLALFCIAPIVHADDPAEFKPFEAWYVMKIGGQKAGYTHITAERRGDQLINTSVMKIAIKRGQAEVAIEQSTRFTETLDHKPIRAQSTMALGAMATSQQLDFTGEAWELTTTTAGQATTTSINAPDDAWLTPAALSAYVEAAIARGDKTITARSLDLSAGTAPVTITMTRGESADIEAFGKIVPATRWELTVSAAPGVAIEQWADDAGQAVRQVMPMLPGMEMEMLLADKQLAMAEFDAPEMLAASLITPDKKIENPRRLKRAVFELVAEGLKKNLGEVVPDDGSQRTEWVDGKTLRIEIDLDQPVVYNKTEADEVYAAASSMLNHEDQAVMKLVNEVMKREHVAVLPNGLGVNHAPIASNLRKAASNHIDAKDLSVGFASASEVARTGQGDCTEHAVLLAAMLRGAGIASRTVTGLVYVDQFVGQENVFGFHMWTQAWIVYPDGKGRWLDLDAAAPGEFNGFDATHIALATSAMADGETFNSMVSLLPIMQDLEIRVIETQWMDEVRVSD